VSYTRCLVSGFVLPISCLFFRSASAWFFFCLQFSRVPVFPVAVIPRSQAKPRGFHRPRVPPKRARSRVAVLSLGPAQIIPLEPAAQCPDQVPRRLSHSSTRHSAPTRSHADYRGLGFGLLNFLSVTSISFTSLGLVSLPPPSASVPFFSRVSSRGQCVFVLILAGFTGFVFLVGSKSRVFLGSCYALAVVFWLCI
jgi:hypothetical protein